MTDIKIGTRHISPEKPYVIAEAGSNHDGSLDDAVRMVDAAAEAGADAIKFQSFRANEMYGDAVYDRQIEKTRKKFKQMELPTQWLGDLAARCDERGIDFLSTPFDIQSADQITEYAPAIKLASSSLSNRPLLEHVASLDRPVIASTGAHDKSEIKRSVSLLQEYGTEFILLHCVSAYPTPVERANLCAVQRLQETFDVPVGLSDHTEHPTLAPTVSVSLGASVIEKHFTLDSSRDGPDHTMSLEPDELSRLVSTVRDTARALGDGELGTIDVESKTREHGRRCLYADETIAVGEKIKRSKITALRPGGRERGISAWNYGDVTGKTATDDLARHDPIQWSDIE